MHHFPQLTLCDVLWKISWINLIMLSVQPDTEETGPEKNTITIDQLENLLL
jgi:hypothetical protein